MSKALSFVGLQHSDGYIYGIEVQYPVVIQQIGNMLKAYNNAHLVKRLINLGDIAFLDTDIQKCVPVYETPNTRKIPCTELWSLKRKYPYVYLFDTDLKHWCFCHKRTETYRHHDIISLSLALNLDIQGKLFQL